MLKGSPVVHGSRQGSRLASIRTPLSDSLLVDALDAGVIVVRRDGKIARANPCSARILGVSYEELGMRDIAEVIAPLSTLLAAAGDERPDKRGEIAFKRRDGSSATLGLSISTFEDEANGVHHAILFRDISNVLELRRQRDRLLQMAALGDVLPSVLHELRNPLAAVTSMLELMIEETEGSLQSDLHALLWELRRMNLNLQGIGGFSRPVQVSENIAVDHAIREACRILEPTAERMRATIVCKVDDMPLLPLDRSVVGGVVFNLVTNAIDACTRGGQVHVSARLPKPDWFELVVEDNGKGMKAETLSRCCELFFTEKDGGSGIGLALCKEAAVRADGTLDVWSAPHAGTRVTMRIPLTRGSKQHGGE